MIGLAAAMLLWFNGRVTGISGMINGAIEEKGTERTWRALFLIALIGGALLYSILQPDDFVIRQGFSLPLLALAGFLVGFGTRMGGGCTSGHGVCGISRLSIRSVVATITFMASAVLTTTIVRHVLGVAN